MKDIRFIQVKSEDNELYNINIVNICWFKAYKVGLSYQVQFKTIDGRTITTIITLDSLRYFERIADVKKLN